MSWFARIEERCASVIERAFAGMFPSDVEPAQIARKLIATMEARTQQSDGEITAPARYAVRVNPLDFARLDEHRAYLEKEWGALLADVAQRVGIRLEGKPAVTLSEHERVAAGAIEVQAESGDASEAPGHFLLQAANAESSPFLINGATRVGRGPQCDIVLSDPSVSRSHALLDVRGGVLTVQDAGSTNGTFINGERVQSVRVLAAGDHIAFGKTEMRVGEARR